MAVGVGWRDNEPAVDYRDIVGTAGIVAMKRIPVDIAAVDRVQLDKALSTGRYSLVDKLVVIERYIQFVEWASDFDHVVFCTDTLWSNRPLEIQ